MLLKKEESGIITLGAIGFTNITFPFFRPGWNVYPDKGGLMRFENGARTLFFYWSIRGEIFSSTVLVKC